MYNKQSILRYFRQLSEQISKIDNLQNLIVVFGGKKAGKSVTVDLLSGKKMILSQDYQSGAKTILQENNWECQYDSMNKFFSKDELIIQSLTLSIDIKNLIQTSKVIVLMYLLKQYQRVSFVLVIEQAKISTLNHQLQEILGILGQGADIKISNMQIIHQFLYIIISKSTKSIMQISKQIEQIPQSNHIKKILDNIIKRQAILLFPCQQPSFGQSFKSKIITKNSQYINKNIINSIYYVSQIHINRQQQTQLIDFIQKLLVAIGNLIAYVDTKQNKYSKEYKKLMNQIFSSHLNKNSIEIMTQNISQYRKVNTKGQIQSLFVLVQSMVKILFEFKGKNSRVLKDYNYFCNLLKLFIISMPFIYQQKVQIIWQKMKPFKQFILQANHKIDRNVGIRRSLKDKNTILSFFKQLVLQNCFNNQDAVKFCIQFQSKKHINQCYNISKYLIKLLKDLFILFMQKYCSQSLNFSQQILQLCLIEYNYYCFNIQLNRALSMHYIQMESLDKLRQRLFAIQRYDECLTIIDYLIQFAIQPSKLKDLNQHKRLVLKAKIQDFHRYKAKENRDNKQIEQQYLKIPFSFQSLIQRFSLLSQVLGRNDFVEMINEYNIY